jgi:geranylgeranyl pyrophosphate synthase
MSQSEIVSIALAMVERRGRNALEKAKQEILSTAYDNGEITAALKHYAENKLPLVTPIFPALMSLSYEAVKGSQDARVESIASAMALIAFSADIHDDIIDKTDVKYGKKTVYGEFGLEVALLAGDALLIQGNTLLHQTCESLMSKQRQAIFALIPKALFEISSAEALAIKLKKKAAIDPDEYFEIMRLKGVVPEIQCRIGGIIGQANNKTLEALSRYGRIVGMLAIIGDEFRDMFNASELEHRIKFEYLPLPMIYATQDEKARNAIEELIAQQKYSQTTIEAVAKLVLETEGVYRFRCKFSEQINQELNNWILTKKSKAEKDAALLLKLFLTQN